MLERRAARRRRVCLEGRVSPGEGTPALVVRVRDIGADGAQIVTDAEIGDRLGFGLARADGCRPAQIVWRGGGRVGLRFAVSDADRREVRGALALWRERLAEMSRCARAPGEAEPVSSSRP